MFQLLRFFSECCVENEADDNSTKADKKAAQQLIIEHVMPLNQQWLHSFSPATVDAGTGNNVLHEMCSFLLMSDQEDWDYQLAEWFIDRGVSVHAQQIRPHPAAPIRSHRSAADRLGRRDATAAGARRRPQRAGS